MTASASNDHKRYSSSGEWEDIQDEGKPPSDDPEEIAPISRTPTRSRKRVGTRTVYIASTSPKKLSTPQRPPRPSVSHISRPVSPPATRSKDEIEAVLWKGARSGTIYVLDVLSSFFFLMKKPLAAFLAVWVLAVTLNALSNHLRMVFAPLCIFPGVSRSWLCMPPSAEISTQQDASRSLMHADFPLMVEMQSKSFEQLLDESVGGSGLALEIKKAEMATTDLVTLVRVSKLTSKDLLAEALVEFVGNARETARGLLKLSAKVSSSVDDILAINDYALRAIEAPNASGSSLMGYLWPFSRNSGKTDLLTTTFSQSLSVLSTSFQRLIIQAEVSLHSLDKLEMQLNNIQDILTREGVDITAAQSDVLADLWTKLGGNREQLRSFKGNLRLLKELGSYRSRALAHVVGALQALQTLSADMEELRERVAAPELTGEEIPVEVHVRSIRSGIERLNEGRVRAREKEEDAMKRILGPLETA